jgi:hypothetical protein
MIVSRGAFPAVCVAHRDEVVDQVIAGAVEVSKRFDALAGQVERMEHPRMSEDEQIRFAERALVCAVSGYRGERHASVAAVDRSA